MTRYKLKNLIRATFTKHQSDLANIFSKLQHLCLTVDIWGNKHRSFLGVTAHYLDPTNFRRKSVALSCSRFPHPHTCHQIAEQIQLLYAIYQLTSSKVVATISDNARNFEKAFREYGLDFSDFAMYTESIPSDDITCQNDQSQDETIIFPEVLETTILSNRMKCASHTLNLIGTKDITKAQADKIYSILYVTAFSKLNRLWNKTQYSKSSELIVSILHSSLGRPCTTRWNAVPRSINEILSKDFGKMNQLMEEFKIQIFSKIDWDFLKEYVTVLNPITSALDNLQKTDCHFGILLPTLFTAKRELASLASSEKIKYCKSLAKAALDGLNDRFDEYMNFKSKKAIPALLATCTHPYFKLAWLGEQKTPENIESIKQILLKAAKDIDINGNETLPNETNESIKCMY